MKEPELKLKNKTHVNMVGIIPIAGQPLDFNFPWHDSLMPIGRNYLAVEKSVLDCAVAGCDTIWIVCPKDIQPLVRYRLGDWIVDPIKFDKGRTFGRRPKIYEIPIYYVPMLPKDSGRRDSIPWSIITGAQYAWHVSKKLSRYTYPDKYFVSFPYGMFSPYWYKQHRSKIRSTEANFYVSYEGKNFKDGLWLPFTFMTEDFVDCRRFFRKNETKGHNSDGERLKAADRWSGRFFTHDYVFNGVRTDNATSCEVPWYYDVSSWEGLKTWLGSENKLDKPKEVILSYNEWNPLGVDADDEQEE